MLPIKRYQITGLVSLYDILKRCFILLGYIVQGLRVYA